MRRGTVNFERKEKSVWRPRTGTGEPAGKAAHDCPYFSILLAKGSLLMP